MYTHKILDDAFHHTLLQPNPKSFLERSELSNVPGDEKVEDVVVMATGLTHTHN